MEWGGVQRVESKGPKTLPCGMPNSNRTGCDFELESYHSLKMIGEKR